MMSLDTVKATDLRVLTDAEFRDVVNADLRHRVDPILSQDVRSALRSAHAVRWRATLTGILRAVDSQLAAKGDEHAAETLRLQGQMEAASPNQRRDIEQTLNKLTETHLRWRSGTERFLSGVREHLAIANGLCADTDAARERELLARRVQQLEDGIREHRREVIDELSPDEDPADADRELWNLVKEER